MQDDEFAHELVEALAAPASMTPFTARDPGFDLARAYAVAARLHARRLERGDEPIGRKIGFTNRALWDQYGVREPIWGFVYDTTLFRPRGGHATLALGALLEPKIEPEIVLHFKSPPPAVPNEAAVLDCVDWIAHGFEIVQSPFPDWKFGAPDAVAAGGLHGSLIVGEPVAVASIDDCVRRLREFRLTLRCGNEVRAEGRGANVLDSPLLAAAHLAGVLAGLPQFRPIAAGELVTTGTVTAPYPVKPGQTWSTTLAGVNLPGLAVSFR